VEASHTEISLDPRFRVLLEWWERKRAGRAVPDRRDIDAVELGPALLPHLVLVELVGREDCRYRLVGTEVVRRLGFDPTGKRLSEALSGGYRAYLMALVDAVTSERRPVWSSSLMQRPGRPPLETRRLFLPFTRGGERVEVVLAIHSFNPPAPGESPAPRGARILEGGEIRELARHVLEPGG
jgi:hypothetical protein